MDNAIQGKVLSGYKEMAHALGVSTKTIQRHRKKMPISGLGKNNFILYGDLIDWMRKNPKWKHQKRRRGVK